MRNSTQKIRTSHAGRLPAPEGFADTAFRLARGEVGNEEVSGRVVPVVADIVKRQVANIVEHPELVARRLVDWAGIVGRENVVGGADCGMGGRVHAEIGWAKLAALAEGAAIATRGLWR